jgi:hypothetical protein
MVNAMRRVGYRGFINSDMGIRCEKLLNTGTRPTGRRPKTLSENLFIMHATFP